jgi:hypothetical protein
LGAKAIETAIRAKKERSWKVFMVAAFIDGSFVDEVQPFVLVKGLGSSSRTSATLALVADLSCDARSSFCNFRVPIHVI